MCAHLLKGPDFHNLKLLVTHSAQFVRGERNIRRTATFGDSSLARPNYHDVSLWIWLEEWNAMKKSLNSRIHVFFNLTSSRAYIWSSDVQF